MRLYAMADGQDSLVCHDEKLASGGSAAYVRSCKHFLANTIFGNETPWPTVIVAPSHLRKSATSIDVSAFDVAWDHTAFRRKPTTCTRKILHTFESWGAGYN